VEEIAIRTIVLPSSLGPFGIVWRQSGASLAVSRILLPGEEGSPGSRPSAPCADAVRGTHPAIVDLGQRLQRFLEGQPVEFDLGLMALDDCSEFQKRVLLAEHAIPRGWVTTYGRLASHLGVGGGARCVGGALARNPFPIVIPCHRTIRSDGLLGGYQGGLDMKRTLLVYEGVDVSAQGKALTDRICY
jgi:methylated-DNA-[protein]-cysteine S-methyltransferase